MPQTPSASPDVLIAGASARAAVFSAIRAGLTVAAADLFADRDLAAVAAVKAIEHWPDDIEAWAAGFRASIPLVYVGGLENHPELLARIARDRPIAGIIGGPLHILRTPEMLHRLFSTNGLPIAPIDPATTPPGGRWLIKPRRSGGGRGIRFAESPDDHIATHEYRQQYVDGTPGSASYLCPATGPVEFIGACDSLPDADTSNSGEHDFRYYGSMTCDDAPRETLNRIGTLLGSLGLRGLIGVDFMLTDAGECVVIEINPRYTASMELFEQQTGRSLIAEHLAAFGLLPSGGLPNANHEPVVNKIFGKRIVYAPYPLRADLDDRFSRDSVIDRNYARADIPDPTTVIETVSPICTVFAQASTAELCWNELLHREREVLSRCRSA